METVCVCVCVCGWSKRTFMLERGGGEEEMRACVYVVFFFLPRQLTCFVEMRPFTFYFSPPGGRAGGRTPPRGAFCFVIYF